MKELLTEYAANLSVEILEMEIMPDHVHMLLEVDPQFGIHKAVKSFKGYTSRILRQEFPYLKTKMPTLWTNKAVLHLKALSVGLVLENLKIYFLDGVGVFFAISPIIALSLIHILECYYMQVG